MIDEERLIKLGQPRFEPGYWRGMRQPAVLVSLHLTRLEISATALRHFDDLRAAVCPLPDRDEAMPQIEATLLAHPLLGRVLPLCLDILWKMGMPIMGGARAFSRQPQQSAQSWEVGLPAISAGIPAPQATLALTSALINDLARGMPVSTGVLEAELKRLALQFQQLAPAGMNTLQLLRAAHEMNVPWKHVANNVYQFGWGRNARWLDSSFTDETSQIGASLARDKLACAKVLREAGLPVPNHQLVASVEHALRVAQALGYPVVVKPANLDGGRGVFAGVRDPEAAKKAFAAARKLSRRILVEQFVRGNDYRIRVYRNEVLGVVLRRPASVIGDGKSTIEVLIQNTNSERAQCTELRDLHLEQGLKPIVVDDEVHQCLADQHLGIESVASSGKRVLLRGAANFSQGGTVQEVMRYAHPDNLDLAVQAAATLRLDVAGVDLLVPDISRSWKESGGAICEVNAQPQFSQRSIHQFLERALFGNGRIPIIGISEPSRFIDLDRALVQELQSQSLNICVAKTAEQCRRAMGDRRVDAIIYSPATWQEAEGLPFDSIDLYVVLEGRAPSHQRCTLNQEVEHWLVGPDAREHSELPSRLIEWVTASIRKEF